MVAGLEIDAGGGSMADRLQEQVDVSDRHGKWNFANYCHYTALL